MTNDEMEALSPEDKEKFRKIGQNLVDRMTKIGNAMVKIQSKMVGAEVFGEQSLVNSMKLYTDYQNTMYWLQTMYNAIFPKPNEQEEAVQMVTPESKMEIV